MSKATLLQGDCMELMSRIPDGSIDMVLSDLPYGTTRCQPELLRVSSRSAAWMC